MISVWLSVILLLVVCMAANPSEVVISTESLGFAGLTTMPDVADNAMLFSVVRLKLLPSRLIDFAVAKVVVVVAFIIQSLSNTIAPADWNIGSMISIL